jgi:hypothetical protein
MEKKNKKRNETQALKFEGKEITDQQTIAEIFNEFVAFTENVKRQLKIVLLMMITIIWKVMPILWNKLLISLIQVRNVNVQK